jgi:hypothetical protein
MLVQARSRSGLCFACCGNADDQHDIQHATGYQVEHGTPVQKNSEKSVALYATNGVVFKYANRERQMSTYLAVLKTRTVSFSALDSAQARRIATQRYGSELVSVMLHTPATR